jgi:hypothetical protein
MHLIWNDAFDGPFQFQIPPIRRADLVQIGDELAKLVRNVSAHQTNMSFELHSWNHQLSVVLLE